MTDEKERKKKKRKIVYRLGNLEWIEVPTDWHNVSGINSKRTETNMGLANMDYTKECITGSEPLMVVEGFWIWWCKTHNHPLFRCEIDKMKIGKVVTEL